MRIIVAGSRSFLYDEETESYDYDTALLTAFFEFHKLTPTEIVCGMARGADTLGLLWAKENNIKLIMMPANWSMHGKRAGILRNEEMGDYADALVAFWDGQSPGTKHMISYMKRKKKPLWIINI